MSVITWFKLAFGGVVFAMIALGFNFGIFGAAEMGGILSLGGGNDIGINGDIGFGEGARNLENSGRVSGT